jgi:hypothetical protein
VVIDIINILRVSVKAEDNPPVGANRYRPKAFVLAARHTAQNAISKSCIVCRRTENKRASLSSLDCGNFFEV